MTPGFSQPGPASVRSSAWLGSVGLERRAESGESRGLVGVGGLRQRGSARFAPYYKAQWYDEKQLAWRDVQRQFTTPDEARATFKKGKWRVMEITMTGRHPL